MWPNPQFLADLVPLIEEILNGKLHFFVQWEFIYLVVTFAKDNVQEIIPSSS